MCRGNNFSHFCQIIFSIHRELPNLFINTYIPGPHVHFSIHIPRWRINTLQYHRFVVIDSVDKRFKLNKRSSDITNSGNQRHEGYDFPCFNLPTWTPGTMRYNAYDAGFIQGASQFILHTTLNIINISWLKVDE